MSKIEVKCKQCKEPFMARVADRERGWARFCSKSCKAKKQTKTIPFNKDTQRSYIEKKSYFEDVKDASYFGDVEDEENFGNITIDN